MKKKLLIILLLIIIVTGCGTKQEKEDPNLELIRFIKRSMTNWDYEEDKLQIKDNTITITLNNVDDWDYCGISSNDYLLKINEDAEKELKDIKQITFICKNDNNITGKVEYNNVLSINKDNINENAIYYNNNSEIKKDDLKNTFKQSCVSYKYKEIFRNPESFEGKRIKITGEVIQVLEDTQDNVEYWNLRVNMTKDKWGYYDDTIMVYLDKNLFNGRIIEDDIIDFYGFIIEPVTYETIFGGSETIPGMNAIITELKK